MVDPILRPGHATTNDVVLSATMAVGLSLSAILWPGHSTSNDVTLRAMPVGVVVEAGGGPAFPTQYQGLRVRWVTNLDLCLVAIADAPTGMGGSPRVRKNGVDYAIYLVETTDPHASPVRLRTSAGTKAIRLYTT